MDMRLRTVRRSFVLLTAVLSGALLSALVLVEQSAHAQPPGQARPARGGPKAGKPGGKPQQPGQKPGQPNQNGEQPKDGQGGEKKGEENKDEASKTVKRSDTPDTPPDPSELEVRPGDDGKVEFNFRGQPWQAVLEWLADISQLSFDWQELPSDYLNLTTRRSYTVPETRDLINMHLLRRGFTILVNEEVMSVVKIEGMNPSAVPRVVPEELEARHPHEFLKVSFPLDWLMAEEAVEEIKPMLSANHKITPLKATNRVEVVDTARNLRDVNALLSVEQSDRGQERLLQNIPLQYTRAADVIDNLKELLGVETKPAGPMTPEQMRQQQQMMQQMRQQQKQGGQPGGQKEEAKIYLVADVRNNSILANAPPNKMALIKLAVETIDTPPDPQNSLLLNMARMQIHRLASLDPEAFKTTLEEVGNLEPSTKLQVDKKNNALIATGSRADQLVISELIAKLDGSSRSFEVIALRRLYADDVAGTIEKMMGGKKEDDSQNQRRGYFSFYSWRRNNDEDEKKDEFRVDADVANNQLLLWANEIEYAEVRNLLVKLGEIPPEGGKPQKTRYFEVAPGEETREFLEQLREVWPNMGENPLEIIGLPPTATSTDKEDQEEEEPRQARLVPLPRPHHAAPRIQLVQLTSEEASEEPSQEELRKLFEKLQAEQRAAEREAMQPEIEEPSEPPPIRISVSPQGELMISSDDTEALDRLEQLIDDFAPRPRDFIVFRLKYAWAYSVKLNLEEIFEEGEEESGSNFDYWYWGYRPRSNSSKKSSSALSRRRPLKFVSDSDTNTLLVQGGTPEQLETVRELIDFYDQPPTDDSQSAHQTEFFHLKFAKAEEVAEVVKDVFRDLLSSNDKALQNNKKEDRPERRIIYDFGEGDDEQTKKPRFKGLLSMGVDQTSNSLVVSAAPVVMVHVKAIVHELDRAARPSSTIEVVRVNSALKGSSARAALARLLGEAQAQANKDQKKPGEQGNEGEGKPEGNGNRGEE